TGALRPSVGDVDGDGRADLIIAPGSGTAAKARFYDALTLAEMFPGGLDPFPGFNGGLFAAGLRAGGEPEGLASFGRAPRTAGTGFFFLRMAAIPLAEVKLPNVAAAPPREVEAFLREAQQRADRLQDERRAAAFVPSDHLLVYQALRAVAAERLAPGDL